MTFDPNDPTPPADLNSPDQYAVTPQIAAATGVPYVDRPGALGRLIWAPVPGSRNAVTGEPIYGPKRVGTPVFTGGKSADGSATRAR